MAAPWRDIGPCAVEWNSVDYGATEGGVRFRSTWISKKVFEDQKGETAVDAIRMGMEVEAEVPLTRSTLAQMAAVMPGASVSGSRMDVYNNQIGSSEYDDAQTLILKPIIDGVATSDTSQWITIDKATPRPEADLAFDKSTQRVVKVLFSGYPDASTALMWYAGG